MIETWGTEIALVIAVLGALYLNFVVRGQERREFMMSLLLRVVNTFAVAAIVFYIFLTIEGVAL